MAARSGKLGSYTQCCRTASSASQNQACPGLNERQWTGNPAVIPWQVASELDVGELSEHPPHLIGGIRLRARTFDVLGENLGDTALFVCISCLLWCVDGDCHSAKYCARAVVPGVTRFNLVTSSFAQGSTSIRRLQNLENCS
jgi:hypothetical protein